MAHFFLDIDRASSVFALLFGFLRDEACDSSELYSFDEALQEILMGVNIPEEAREKLERIYRYSLMERAHFSSLVDRVAQEFCDERENLVAIVKILLRLSMDDGLVSRRDKERLREVILTFDFSLAELRSLSAVENQMISFISEENPGGRIFACSEELRQQYQKLGCSPDCTDQEVKAAYRKLAKANHPDSVLGSSIEKASSSEKFQEIHNAFQAIQRARLLA